MITSNNNKQYNLKRTQSAAGVQFTSGTAKFWTDGLTVTLEGTETPFVNCKLQAG